MRGGDPPAYRGDHPDPALPTFTHPRRHRERGIDRTPEHGVDCRDEVLASLGVQWADLDDAGNTDHHLDRADPGLGAGDQGLDLGIVGDVTDVGRDPSPVGTELLSSQRQPLRVARRNHHPEPLAIQLPGDQQP